jgi:hypothetical protein
MYSKNMTDNWRSVNHTVRLDIWESAQHGFVGQAWSGPGVGIRPTRCPLRPAVRRDESWDRLKGCGVTDAMIAAPLSILHT